MKILHAISSLNLNSGGPSLSTWSLVKGLRSRGINTELLTFSPQNEEDKMIGVGDFLHIIPSPEHTRYGFSKLMKNFLSQTDYDIYHGHALWQYPVHGMATAARNLGKPYIISPRGMLYPEGLNKSKGIKKLSFLLYQRYDLKKATVLHATCMQELAYIRQNGFLNPVAVIPNAIDINLKVVKYEKPDHKISIGFVGRFAPIKNIESLIKAWTMVAWNRADCELVLIGDGDTAYKNNLSALVDERSLDNVRFTGFLNGEAKEKALQSLHYLVLPSKSENFGMVVPEALLRGIPVIASKGTPWEELNTHGCGWWVENNIETLAQALKQALALSEAERQQMGLKGRKLVEENYSIEAVAEKIHCLYNWILTDKKKPEFIY